MFNLITIKATLVISFLAFTKAKLKFSLYDSDLFIDCENDPDAYGLSDFLDISELSLSYEEDGIHFDGNVTFTWDVAPTDRVEMKAEVFKNVRNTWQVTPFSVTYNDWCKEITTPDNVLYDVWATHILDEDRDCPTKNKKYRHEPFIIKGEFDVAIKMSGTFKVVIKAKAFSESNKLKFRTCVYLLVELEGV